MSDIKPVILLVEDDMLLLLDARMALEDNGYAVVEASDAATALDHLDRRDDIAAIISDVAMPGAFDGLGLVAQVRVTHPHLPVVLTTGSGDISDPPADVPIVTKPYRTRTLADLVGGALAVA